MNSNEEDVQDEPLSVSESKDEALAWETDEEFEISKDEAENLIKLAEEL